MWKSLKHGDRSFNPRSYKRSDPTQRIQGERYKRFQSTLLQEERRFLSQEEAEAKFFQSTLLQEERPPYTYTSRKPSHTFNPRSYKRSDKEHTEQLSTAETFNPRSYKRSDVFCNAQVFCAMFFQSTLLQEERHVECIFHDRIISFNPRSYKRSDSKNAQYSLCISAIIIA